MPPDLPEHKSDNRILKVCVGLSNDLKEQVILVTKDILLRIKAQLLGIQAEDLGQSRLRYMRSSIWGGERCLYQKNCLKILRKREFR